jgi:hypothetical protein
MKTLLLSCCLLSFVSAAKAQTASVEDRRAKLLRAFCEHVRQTPERELDQTRLQTYLQLSDSAWVVGSRQNRILHAALGELGRELEGTDLARHDAVPWREFPRQDKLPRMVWEAEPVGQIMGQPLPTGDREEELAEGRRQRNNTMVVFAKDDPDTPVWYVLFDEATGRIASWVLVNQGGLHYFLFL